MKKTIKVSLSLLLCILTLSGCGKGETTIPSSTPGSTNTVTPTTPTDKDTTTSSTNAEHKYTDFSEGLVLYHVDAQLISYKYNGQTGLDLFTTNDHGEDYYTGVNLIELEKLTSSSYTLGVGQTSKSSIYDDNGSKINYTFKLNSIDGSKANITFKANK